MKVALQEVEQIEITTLVDNYVDMLAADSGQVVHRATALTGLKTSDSILAEHGFSALVTVSRAGRRRSILMDFGYSALAAAENARTLGLDLSQVEALVLSHGHPDHIGALERITALVGQSGIELLVHPAAFKAARHLKSPQGAKVFFDPFTRERVEAAGVKIVEAAQPRPLLDGGLVFLGQIPKKTDFEQAVPFFKYEDGGEEKTDLIEDDTAIVAQVRGKGLVVLSGCAHSGIINTLKWAEEVTGQDQILAVMGGFHLTGPLFENRIQPTIEALKALNPRYVLPTHCTGRKAIMAIEKAMPEQFILNMAGTRLTFAA